MKEVKFSQDLETLVGLFDVNARLEDDVHRYLQSISEARRNDVKREMQRIIEFNLFASQHFYRFTSCSARDDRSARQFFEDVCAYAFEGGEQPDVRDYWDRD